MYEDKNVIILRATTSTFEKLLKRDFEEFRADTNNKTIILRSELENLKKVLSKQNRKLDNIDKRKYERIAIYVAVGFGLMSLFAGIVIQQQYQTANTQARTMDNLTRVVIEKLHSLDIQKLQSLKINIPKPDKPQPK